MAKPKFLLKGKKKQVITVVVVILLLIAAGAAGVLLQWLQHKGTTPKSGSGSSATSNLSGLTGQNSSTLQDSLPQSVKDAQNTAANGDISQSNNQIAASIATSSDNTEKYDLYLQQGANYENQGQYDNAIAAYKSALALQKTSVVYKSLGRASASKGDKQSALSYYKLALPLLDQTDPIYPFEKSELEQDITSLGG